MTLHKAIEVIAALKTNGVIEDYAIVGAVAALAYIEPTLTEDLDILISTAAFQQRPSGLILLTPLDAALAEMGYSERSDVGVLVEGWPIQFLPVSSALDAESLDLAVEMEVSDGTPFIARVLRPEHVVAKAVSVGRLKDLARVEAFLDQQVVDLAALAGVIERHGLIDAWRTFCAKSGRADPLGLG